MFQPFHFTLLNIKCCIGIENEIALNNADVDLSIHFGGKNNKISHFHLAGKAVQHTGTCCDGSLFGGRVNLEIVTFIGVSCRFQFAAVAKLFPPNGNHILNEEQVIICRMDAPNSLFFICHSSHAPIASSSYFFRKQES